MYCPLINRFRGAFLGSAIAEMQFVQRTQRSGHLSLTRMLSQEGQNISSMTLDISPDEDRTPKSEVQTVARSILISLMLHDCDIERVQALKSHHPSRGLWVLSEALFLGLHQQSATIEALSQNIVRRQLEDSSISSLLATLDGLKSQRVPLQTATRAIADLPDLTALDQTIALALYCWLCTPQQFQISVGRSHQAGKYLAPENGVLASAITGVLAGVSVGLESIPPDAPCKEIFPPLTPVADRLFQAWAGISPGHPNVAQLQQLVVARPGALKPRDAHHLELNSNYD